MDYHPLKLKVRDYGVCDISYHYQGHVQDLRKGDTEPEARAKVLATPPKH